MAHFSWHRSSDGNSWAQLGERREAFAVGQPVARPTSDAGLQKPGPPRRWTGCTRALASGNLQPDVSWEECIPLLCDVTLPFSLQCLRKACWFPMSFFWSKRSSQGLYFSTSQMLAGIRWNQWGCKSTDHHWTPPLSSDFTSLERGLKMCISNKFPRSAETAAWAPL